MNYLFGLFLTSATLVVVYAKPVVFGHALASAEVKMKLSKPLTGGISEFLDLIAYLPFDLGLSQDQVHHIKLSKDKKKLFVMIRQNNKDESSPSEIVKELKGKKKFVVTTFDDVYDVTEITITKTKLPKLSK